ncbi:hypothetical protein E4U49_004057 [Claviceps purpurea]|nr:hypothetical protein E4U49_004057 [Claviceps purpurea]
MPEAGTFLDPTRPPIDFVQRRELLQPCPCVAYRFGSRSPQLKGAPRSSDTTQCLTLAAGVSSPREAPDGGYEFYRRREDGNKNGQRQDPLSPSSPTSARRGFKLQAQDPMFGELCIFPLWLHR